MSAAFLPAPIAGAARPGPRMVRLAPWDVRIGDRFVHYTGVVTDVRISAGPLGGLRYAFLSGTTEITWRESHEFLCVFRGAAQTETDLTPPHGIDRPRHLHLVGTAS